MKYCTNCGTQLLDDDAFCTKCGIASPQLEPPIPVTTSKKNIKSLLPLKY